MTSAFAPSMASSRAKVVIDWSHLFQEAKGNPTESAPNVEQLVNWVRHYPRRGDIQIHLQSKIRHEQLRKLQRALQSLGCTVVTRYFVA